MTEQAAIALQEQTAEAVVEANAPQLTEAELQVTEQNALAAQAMLNEGAPELAPLEFEGDAPTVPQEQINPAPDVTPSPDAAVPPLNTVPDTATLEQYLRQMVNGDVPAMAFIPQKTENGDILLVTYDENEKCLVKVFAIMGELARNITKLPA